MNLYPYATGNRLEERNSYSYSPYVGADLFIAWVDQRDVALRVEPDRTASARSDKPTDRLLADLLTSLAAGTVGPADWARIDSLLQRFEVSKRLHGEYNIHWRPVTPADYDGMERYLRFAEMIDMAYQASDRLQYLNGLLKCMDTLTSQVSRLDATQATRLTHLIEQERRHVDKLAQSLGVHLPDAVTRGCA